MNPGKRIRMSSIFSSGDRRSVIVAIDHGGIAGPIPGIEKPAALLRACVRGGADAVLTTRGFVKASGEEWSPATALILRLTGGFTVLGGGFEEEQISGPETALRYGAAAAAVTVKFGHSREGEFIRQASLTADSCDQWNLPLMVEALAVGKELSSNDPEGVKLAARAAQEIGADIVKCRYTGDPESFHAVHFGHDDVHQGNVEGMFFIPVDSRNAVARPIPEPAPVMIATLSTNFIIPSPYLESDPVPGQADASHPVPLARY